MSQIQSLEQLLAEARALVANIDRHLERHPSPRLSHHRPTFLVAAIERELELAAPKKHDAHTVAMAKRLHITPEAFLELQDKRRGEMQR